MMSAPALEVGEDDVELLRPQDAFFLYTETPCVQQHVGGLAILDPSSRPGGPLLPDDLKGLLAGRLHRLPRLRQRLAVPPLGLARAAWLDDDAFDLDRHVRRLRLPEPGGWRELCALVEAVMAEPLDRSRPLWELYLVDGLQHGRQAVVLKLHHAIADGLGALNIAQHLFGLANGRRSGVLRLLRASGGAAGPPPSSPEEPSSWRPAPAPSRARLFWRTLASQVAAPWRAFGGALLRTCRHPARSLRRAGEIVIGIWQLARAGRAPRCALNREVGAGRRIVLTEMPLEHVKRIRGRLGGTINDIVLTLIAEGLHGLLELRGERAATMRVMVPVAVRPPGEAAAPGTWTSALSLDLPLAEMPPTERLAAVRALTKRAKRSHQALGATFVMQVVGAWAPAPLHARAARFAYRGCWFNLIVTTLRGVASPVDLAGARVVVAYPLMPLAEDVGVTAAALTWGDRLTIGITADEGTVPDLELVSSALLDAAERLYRAACDPHASRTRRAV
jgi:diacylglycerol O-acyltransferase / wax synthase